MSAAQETIAAGGLVQRLTRWAGPGAERPLLALHGFTGDGLDWAPLVPLLGRAVLAPDLVGHGGSEAPDDLAAYALPAVTRQLVALLDALHLEAVDVIGYSLGGRVALGLALDAPERVARLVLVGATPGIADPLERAARRAEDEALAARIEAEGVAAFLAEWERRPIIASQVRIDPHVRRAMRARRRTQRARGLARSLRGTGTGSMAPRWDDLPRLAAPALLVTGAEDAKFEAIAARMRARLPRPARAVIPAAGHAAHLERPVAAAAAIRAFLGGSSELWV